MQILFVYVQHKQSSLNRPFTYLYNGDEHLKVGCRVLINFHNQKIAGYIDQITLSDKTQSELEEEYGFELKFIDRVVDKTPILSPYLLNLAKDIASYYYAPIISVLQAMLPPKLSPSYSKAKNYVVKKDKFLTINKADFGELKGKQKEVYELILEQKEVAYSIISAKTVVKKLLEKEYISIIYKDRDSYVFAEVEKETTKLNKAQEHTTSILLNSNKEINLLEGVTGSGKTRVYLALAKHYLTKKQTVLILVPEISLTPSMVETFAKEFGNKIAILHSGLKPEQKYEQYQKIVRKEVNIVIGARSAVFAPLDNIGLIVIDEEHSSTYKQDQQPFYDVLTIASMRAKKDLSKIVLGSATPLVETRIRAEKGLYGWAKLDNKYHENTTVSTSIIDMNDKNNHSGESPYLSKQLLEAIRSRIDLNQQVILLVNKRGYANVVRCKDCHSEERCLNCGKVLTYHKSDDSLKCHSCGTTKKFAKTCSNCHSTNLTVSGFGTQKAVEQISAIFKDVKTLRLDSDKGSDDQKVRKILTDFRLQKAQILIGTQMVSKGLDFGNVTLVGVINADSGLYQDSYRAKEEVFNTIYQAVGRTGRGLYNGEAIIQTLNPANPAILYGAQQDYDNFYQIEMKNRHKNFDPPYVFQLRISLIGASLDAILTNLNTLKSELKISLGEKIKIIGPSMPKVIPHASKYQRDILIKYDNYFAVKPFLLKQLSAINKSSSFSVVIDVDCH